MSDAARQQECCESAYRRGFSDAARLWLETAEGSPEGAELRRWLKQVERWRAEHHQGRLEFPPGPPGTPGWDPRR